MSFYFHILFYLKWGFFCCSKLEKQKEKKRKEEQKRKIACLSFTSDGDAEENEEEEEEEEADGNYGCEMCDTQSFAFSFSNLW